MKKILLFGLFAGFCANVFSQSIALNEQSQFNGAQEMTPQMKLQHEAIKQQSFENSQMLVPQTITTDYEFYDSNSWDFYNSFIWRIHEDFTQNDLVITDDGYGVNDTLFWKFNQAAVSFKWLNDSYNLNSYNEIDSVTLDYTQATTTIDSIFYTFGFQNYSGLTTQIRTRVLPVDADGNPDFAATALWEEILESDTSLTEEGYVDVRAIPVGYTLASVGDRFAISVDIVGGDKFLDEFYLIGGYGSPCNEDDAELSKFSPNSYLNPQTSVELGADFINGLQDGENANFFFDVNGNDDNFPNPGECERISIQNWSIWAQLTVDAPFAAIASAENAIICPDGFTTLNAAATSGVEPYTYSWSPDTGLTSPSAAITGVSVSETTDYTVTVTDGNNESSTATVTVTVDGLVVNAGDDTEADCGSTTSVGASVISPNSTEFTYTWAGLDNATCCGDQSSPQNLFQSFGAGIYTITVDDGICSVTDEIEIGLANSNLTASFTSTPVDGFEVEFTSTSNDATVVFWDFGDSNSGNGNVATNTYAVGGTYDVTITTVNGPCTVVSVQQILVVNFTSIDEAKFVNNLNIYPVPAKDNLYINLESIGSNDVNIEIYNAQGQSVINRVATNGVFNEMIDVSALSNGVYYVAFKYDGDYLTKRITINK